MAACRRNLRSRWRESCAAHRGAALIALTGLIAGCVNQFAERQAYVNGFIGQSEVALIQQMGVPSRTYETSGVKYLAYDERRVDIVPSYPAYGPFFMGWYGAGFPPQVIELQCETTFTISDGTVRSATLRGNACG